MCFISEVLGVAVRTVSTDMGNGEREEVLRVTGLKIPLLSQLPELNDA